MSKEQTKTLAERYAAPSMRVKTLTIQRCITTSGSGQLNDWEEIGAGDWDAE